MPDDDMTRIFLGHGRMMQYLKKHTRSHKFREVLTTHDIETILQLYIPKISKLPNVNFKNYPEIHDEYYEIIDRIIISAREELKLQFTLKIIKKFKNSYHDELVLKEYLKTI
jgi:hypothetical protein